MYGISNFKELTDKEFFEYLAENTEEMKKWYAERDLRVKRITYRNSTIWKMLQMINNIMQSDYLGLNEKYVKLLAEYQAEFADNNLALETLDMFMCIKSNEDREREESLPFKTETPQSKEDCPFE